MDFQHSLLGILNFIGVKALSNTNLIASRLIKREKCSLPVDVCGSEISMLKLPLNNYHQRSSNV